MTSLTWILVAFPDMGSALSNQPVPTLDLKRYAGVWHEMAHLPLRFERQCVGDVTATYTVNADNTVHVRNACRMRNGAKSVAMGVARLGHTPGALKVSFAPRWLGWIPWVWADYWVVDVDPDYQWAVVGGPSKKYLWVLSRAPTMPTALFKQLTQRAAARGYPTDKLIMTAPLQ